jgi:hypothetical protein
MILQSVLQPFNFGDVLEVIATGLKFVPRRRITIVSGPEALIELRRFLNAGEPKVQRAALSLWKSQAGMISGNDVEEMIAKGQAPAALMKAWERANSEFAQEAVVPKYNDAFSETEKNLSVRLKRILGKAGLPTSTVVQAWVNAHSGELITRLNTDMHGVIHSILQQHVIRQPMSPFQLSKLIRPHIGLTERFSRAVSRRYQALVDSGVSVEAALAESERYAMFLHKVRGMMIGRQELAMAYGEGQWQALVDAQAAGTIEDRVVKTWATADDERVCDECAGLDGEQQDLNVEFSNGVMHNPAHVQCRCANMHEIIRGS